MRASQVKFGDRLMSEEGGSGQLVVQVSTLGDEIRMSHPGGQTRLEGDPLVRVLRRKPRVVVEDDMPATIWRPLGPRRTQPWEGSDT